ncbi:unnamed protein product [Brassicogethes aeneus]|uniref:Uncharacterized protein n=1 Tax=Brassicogethes aeneus TaxID=1431903 RepID=A0A9P0FH14_BRAAE|nr:unnamed protein product [Brassicogethes aeneus]
MASINKALFVIGLLVLVFVRFNQGGIIKRELNLTSKLEECSSQTPCGWAVYNSSTRKIIYYMKNTCQCGNELKCLRDNEDVSISSYAYYCRKNS